MTVFIFLSALLVSMAIGVPIAYALLVSGVALMLDEAAMEKGGTGGCQPAHSLSKPVPGHTVTRIGRAHAGRSVDSGTCA